MNSTPCATAQGVYSNEGMNADLTTPESAVAIEAGLDPNRIPRHIAIIMDGNGRWAQQRGLPRLAGHAQGYMTVRPTVEAANDLGVEALTLFTFSSENWTRADGEPEGIMRLIARAAREELPDMQRNQVRMIVSGRIDEIPVDVQDSLRQAVEATKKNKRIVLNLAINYGGRNEIIDATRKLAAMVANGDLKPKDIDESLFAKCLYTPQLPDPDLLIRTASELRVSNFLLWQIAYTEIWVTDAYWPDFSRDHLIQAISDYQKRVRKFGKTSEQIAVGE